MVTKYEGKLNHFKSIFSVTKFLIATGIRNEDYHGQNYKSRIIDLSINITSGCFDWPVLPAHMSGATGGLVSNMPLICGGWNYDDDHVFNECHTMDGRKTTLNTTMTKKRYMAASIVLNEKVLWITGGEVDLGVMLMRGKNFKMITCSI